MKFALIYCFIANAKLSHIINGHQKNMHLKPFRGLCMTQENELSLHLNHNIRSH